MQNTDIVDSSEDPLKVQLTDLEQQYLDQQSYQKVERYRDADPPEQKPDRLVDKSYTSHECDIWCKPNWGWWHHISTVKSQDDVR